MSFVVGPARDFGRHRRIVSLDPATTAGLVSLDVGRGEAGIVSPYQCRRTGACYELEARHCLGQRGDELRLARWCADEHRIGPMILLIEAQYIGANPSSATRVIESRARWSMAFEVAAPDTEIVLLPPACWQAGWLGLSSQSGRDALKAASDLSAETAVRRLGPAVIAGPVVGDTADALNMLLWWLSHHLTGMPRRFSTTAERAR